jgi:hypothetical protein
MLEIAISQASPFRAILSIILPFVNNLFVSTMCAVLDLY